MGLLRYLLHRCECCGVKVEPGTGYARFSGFAYLCLECMGMGCYRQVTLDFWVHRGPKA